jgi:error-prone DNA polymerase
MPELPDPKAHPHPKDSTSSPRLLVSSSLPGYAELQVTSNFSFLRGASHPDELVETAAANRCAAIAITDRHTLAGIVRAHVAAKQAGIQLVVGTRVDLDAGSNAEGAEAFAEIAEGELNAKNTKGAKSTEETQSRLDDPTSPPPAPDHASSSTPFDSFEPFAFNHSSSSAPSANASAPSAFDLPDLSILLYPTDRAAYGRLCRLLTRGKRRAPKGECHLTLHDVVEFQEGLLAIVVPPRALSRLDERFIRQTEHLARVFDDDRLSLAATRLYEPGDDEHLERLEALSAHTAVPLVATNDVHCHAPERRALQDVLTCVRLGRTIHEAGYALHANSERHIKGPEEMSRLFARLPRAIHRTAEIAERAAGFSLDQIRYEYPEEVCPEGKSPMAHLKDLTWRGAIEKFGGMNAEVAEGFAENAEGEEEGLNAKVAKSAKTHEENGIDPTEQNDSDDRPRPSSIPPSSSFSAFEPFAFIHSSSAHPAAPSATSAFIPNHVLERLEHEFALIDELGYAKYFLTVHDIVAFARGQGILCQGRGAAANSAVCYYLGITSVDPTRVDMLFERFVSRERDEPPDIDVDFEHERREEVIQYIYEKFGRDRAALTAEVISYRGRSAVRDVGKAMGLSLDCFDRLAKQMDWWDKGIVRHERVAELGLDPGDPTVRMTLDLAAELMGFPRHLSQHVGGFVITQNRLEEIVPIENAAMEDRTVIEWDKDDIDAMGMLKIDCLGLGMLTCIRKAFDLVEGRDGETEKRRDEGKKDKDEEAPTAREGVSADGNGERETRGNERAEIRDGTRADVSGSRRVAEGDGDGQAGVRADAGDATDGAVRPDDADAPRSGVDPLEHRRELRQGEPNRSSPVPPDRPRLTQRAGHADGARSHAGFPLSSTGDQQPHRGNRSSSPGPDPKHDPITSSLRLSVSPSLPPPLSLSSIPPEDPAVYDMLCRADAVGVFQVESRAQMSMLPRLRPRCYYDLVIEVAIVRPGPIQGKMVHPYLRRRNGEEPVEYPSKEIEAVLGRTLGVPLFQEQAMKLAMVAAGFTAGEAEQLRRAMAVWKRKGHLILQFRDKLVSGIIRTGYTPEFAERCFEQIKGFSEYGFPESHAASFAHLVYVSAWLKHYHPAAFAAALINSQPMGFYAPAQIVRDAQEHGVEVRPVDVNHSGWDCSLEERDEETERRRDEERRHRGTEAPRHKVEERHDREAPTAREGVSPSTDFHLPTSSLRLSVSSSLRQPVSPSLPPSLRLGMRLVRSLREDHARAIERAVRRAGPFRSIERLWRASAVPVTALRALAAADAFGSMGLDRRAALWVIRELKDEPMPLWEEMERQVDEETKEEDARHGPGADPPVALPVMPEGAHVVRDYATVGLTLRSHPMSFVRDSLDRLAVRPASVLRDAPEGTDLAVAGIVLCRQRPGTASGVVFMTLEDETGIANLILRPAIYKRDRKVARHSVCLVAHGHVERQGQVVHVLVRRVEALDDALDGLSAKSRNFH